MFHHRRLALVLLIPAALCVHTAANAQCPGDFNADKLVDLGDFAILLSNFGSTVPAPPAGSGFCMGDMDGDGDVDLVDLATFLPNFGLVCGCWFDLDSNG